MSIAKSSKVLILLALVGFVGCAVVGVPGSGKILKATREVETFDRLAIAGAGTVEIVVGGEEQTVEVETDDNLMELVQTQVADGKLQIKFIRSASPTVGLNAKIHVAHLKQLEVAGAYTVSFEGIDEPALSLQTAGSVETTCRGKVGQLSISASGAGTFECKELAAGKVTVDAAGSVTATVNATETLDIKIAGSGTVKYLGDPKVKQSIMGSGTVEKLAEQ